MEMERLMDSGLMYAIAFRARNENASQANRRGDMQEFSAAAICHWMFFQAPRQSETLSELETAPDDGNSVAATPRCPKALWFRDPVQD